jgi:4-amino-4-deoxy-L-arabinose transferase-like glycosyltransferase
MRSDDEAPAEAEPAAEPASESVPEAEGAPEAQAITALPGIASDSSLPPDAPEDEPLVPPGNPYRPMRLLVALAGLVPVFLLMACDRHFGFSVPLGAAGLLVASFAILDALGTFDDARAEQNPEAREGPETPTLREITPRLVELGASLIALTASLRLAVAGVLPWPVATAGVLVTAGLIWIVVCLYRVAEALRIYSKAEALLTRHGFWLVLMNILLYVPMLGSYSLSDPWEAHYGEVSREMLARDDWLSLWWAQDGWFWSKPVLDFWIQGLSFSVTGMHFMPDQVLASAASGHPPAPEWPARLPIFLFTVLATYLLYKAVAKAFGARAGFLSALVLTTAPYWYLIAHQSMTDMPYVAPLTAALALVVLGMRSDSDAKVKTYELVVGKRVLRFSGFHLLFGAVALSVLPQVVYLLSRNLTLQLSASHFGFRWHLDEFFSGSGGGNCGLPGNEECRYAEPVNRAFQPALGGLLWGGIFALLLLINRGERRAQRLYFLAAWYFTALSALGKGAPGLVLPVVIAIAGVGAARRYKDYARLELVGFLLLLACVCLPWYVQMYMRHGPPFTDRLLFHDMYKRAFVHVHDTNTGDDVSFRYYVWQLGYGLFPWSGFGAAGLLWWLRFRTETDDAQSEVMAFMALWFTVAFAMFTITLTKFHHYVLPAVPPIAVVTGVMLERALGQGELTRDRRALVSYLSGMALSAILLVYGAMRLFPGTLSGRLIGGQLLAPSLLQGAAALLCGALVARLAVKKYGLAPSALDGSFSSTYESGALGLLGVSAAIPIVLVGRDLWTTVSGDVEGQARLVHLFSYNYKRPWPSDSLSFDGILLGFTVVSALVAFGFALPSWRRHALVLFSAVAVAWAAWGIDVYLVKAAPHWGQRETILAYYTARKGPEEPFVAYQMNWKGENFYTGNRVPAFVSSGSKFKSWITEQKNKGVHVIFFTTEHSRTSSLKSELGAVKDFKLLTTRALNNKFVLVRVAL